MFDQRMLLDLYTWHTAGDSDLDASSIYIDPSLSTSKLAATSIMWGLPTLAIVIASYYILNKVSFKPALLPSYLAAQPMFHKNDALYYKLVPFAMVGIYVALFLPVLFITLYGRQVALQFHVTLGIALALLGNAALFFLFGFFRWQYNAWRIDVEVKNCMAVSFMLLTMFGFVAALMANPYTYTGVSAVVLCFGLIPVVFFNYWIFLRYAPEISDYSHLGGVTSVERDEGEETASTPFMDQPIASRTRTKTAIPAILYTISLGFLFYYAMLIFGMSDGFNGVGFVSMATIMIVDAALYLNVKNGRIKEPLDITVVQLLYRISLFIFGQDLWYAGQSVGFLIVVVYLGRIAIDKHLPSKDDHGDQPLLNGQGRERATPVARENIYSDYSAVLAVAVFTCLMLIGTIATFATTHNEEGHMKSGQSAFGIAATFLAVIFLTSMVTVRYFYNNNCAIDDNVYKMAALSYALSLASGGILWAVIEHDIGKILMMAFAFVPLIYGLGVVGYSQWVINKYEAWTEQQDEVAQYKVSFCYFTALTLIFFFGIFSSYATDTPKIGIHITGAVLTSSVLILVMIEWMNTFEFDGTIYVNLFLGACFFIGTYVVQAKFTYDMDFEEMDELLIPFLATAFILEVIAFLLYCKEKEWKIELNTPAFYLLTLNVLAVIGADVAILTSHEADEIGFTLATLLFTGLLGLVVVPTLKEMENRSAVLSTQVTMVLALVADAVLLIKSKSGFYGFTLFLGTLITIFLIIVYRDHFRSEAGPLAQVKFMYSPFVFPSYRYDVSPGAYNPLVDNNANIYYVWGSFGLVFLWGAVACFALRHCTFGLLACSLSAVLFVVYNNQITSKPLLLFAKSVQYIQEGSDAYDEEVKEAIKKAKTVQLSTNKYMIDDDGNEEEDELLDITVGPNDLYYLTADDQEEMGIKTVDNTVQWQGKPITWRHLHHMMWELASSIRWSIFDKDEDVRWAGKVFPKIKVVDNLLKLNEQVDALYSNYNRFVTHVQLEVILGVTERKSENANNILTMLRESGKTEITLDYIRHLDDASEERAELEELYRIWTIKSKKREKVLRKARKDIDSEQESRDLQMGAGPMANVNWSETNNSYEVAGKLKTSETGRELPYSDSWVGNSALFQPGVTPTGSKKAWTQFAWQRPNEEAVLFTDGADPNDITQGALGDCWFLSALSVLTLRQECIDQIFVSPELHSRGIYTCLLWKNNEPRYVVVDNKFPVNRNGNWAFGKSGDKNELWVMILEKAYAKLHSSYTAIESGYVDQALVDMTNGIGSRIDLSKPKTKTEVRNGSLWKKLLHYQSQNFLMGAGSPAGSDSPENVSAEGIVQGHAYSVLDVQEIDGLQMIKLRNPWGKGEWNGEFSDASPSWTKRLKKKLNWTDVDDGAFWMQFRDFVLHFHDIYVCRFFDEKNGWQPDPVTINGGWQGKSAGGCTNFPTVKNSPQYMLEVKEPTNILISLAQDDVRGTAPGAKFLPIAIEIYDNDGDIVSQLKPGTLVSTNPEGYIVRREVACEVQLSASPHPYTVLISSFFAEKESNFLLRVNGTAPFSFTAAN